MIGMRTILEVADNSGARRLSCILPRGGDLGLRAGLGDVVTAAVKEAAPDSSIKKGKVVRCVIVRMRKETRRRDGSYIRFDSNAAVLINEVGEPVGNARVRPGGARTARQALHEDRVARAGGYLNMSAKLEERQTGAGSHPAQQERSGEGDRGARQAARPGRVLDVDTANGPHSGRARQHDQAAHAEESGQADRRRHRRKGSVRSRFRT